MTFRELVAEALGVIDRETPLTVGGPLADKVARALADALKREGYSIHRSGECVHPWTRREDLGRPMTPDEEKAVGLAR